MMLLDASAIIAILARQSDGVSLMARLAAAGGKIYVSPLTVVEAVLGLARVKSSAGSVVTAERISLAEAAVAEFVTAVGAKDMVITMEVARLALKLGRERGKIVGHGVGWNLGDCLAQACAQSYRLQLLATRNGAGDLLTEHEETVRDGD